MFRRRVPAGQACHPFLHGTALRLILCALATLALLIFGNALAEATTAVGAIAGSFAVTPAGESAYTMPLPAPGGTNGLAPSLALAYVSGNGHAGAGYGVGIAGLSVIKRCAGEMALDGHTRSITLSASDRFCLDGQELTGDSGTYGDNGATYHVSPTAHLKIISHTSGGSGFSPTSGPQWFTVLHPDGTIYEYGRYYASEVGASAPGGGEVARVWALDAIRDPAGNAILFHYSQPSGSNAWYVSEVEWSANSTQGTDADHSLVFSWVDAPADAVVHRYVAGNLIVWKQRLNKITLEYNGTETLHYSLAYLPDGQGSERSRLANVTECAGGNCLPATKFQWQQGSSGWSGAQSPFTLPAGHLILVDLNGDGRDDLVYQSGGTWWVRFATSTGGFGSEHNTGVGGIAGYTGVRTIRFRGAGYPEGLLYPGTGSHWHVLEYKADGSFDGASTGVSDTGANSDVAVTDVDGDGADDLVALSGSTLMVYPNTGGGFGTPITAYTLPPGPGTDSFVGFRGQNPSHSAIHALHFSRGGDGLVARVHHHEVICYQDGCPPGSQKTIIDVYYDQAFVWTGSGFAPYGNHFAGNGSLNNPGVPAGGNLVPLDVNGDGLTDFVWQAGGSGSTELYLDINTGNGFSETDTGLSDSDYPGLAEAVGADANGDGRIDLLIPKASGDWHWMRATGAGLAAPADLGNAPGSGVLYGVARSGTPNLSTLVSLGTSGTFEYATHQGAIPDLVTLITDGFGNEASPSYAALSDAATVTRGTYGNYPRPIEGINHPVVAQTTQNDGTGGSYTLSYHYSDPSPFAPLGFTTMQTTDSRNGHVTTTGFYTGAPWAPSLPVNITVKDAGGNTLQTLAQTYIGGLNIHPVRVGKRTVKRYSLANGNALVSTSVQKITYDAADEPTDSTTTVTAGNQQWKTDVVPDLTESTDTDAYCLGLPKKMTETRTLPGGASATRETDYTPDTGHCREQDMTANAQDPALSTQTSYTYGSFGNVRQTQVVGHKVGGAAMAPRITHYGYDNSGEFQTSETDPMGEITAYGWNGALGVQASQTPPNGAMTTYAYDGFGRKKKTTLPSGAIQSVTYTACASGCGYPAGAYQVETDTQTAAGDPAGSTTITYDRYGRAIATAQQMPGGKASITARTYDSLGRVVWQSVPRYSGDPVYATQTIYDTLGRVKKITAPASAQNIHGRITQISYDGLITTVNPPDHDVTTVTQNPLGQRTKIVDIDGHETTYTYTPFGQLTQVNGPDGTTTNVGYDNAGHRTSLSGPDRNALSFNPDSLGETVQETNARGQIIGFVYDKLGRLKERSFPKPGSSSTETQSWSYAASGNGTGQIASESDNVTGFSRTVGGYNSLGEPTTIQETLNGIPQTLTLGYDSLGRISSVTYPVQVPTLSADAGPDQSIATGVWATLNGSGTDPGQSLTYQWRIVSGPSGTRPSLTDADQPVAHFESDVPGQWVLGLTVSNGHKSVTDTATVTVSLPAPGQLTASTGKSQGGNYSLSWSSVAGAATYQLWETEQFGTIAPCMVYSSTGLEMDFTHHPNGTYDYVAKACANGVCSAPSESATVSVSDSTGTTSACLPPGTGGGGGTGGLGSNQDTPASSGYAPLVVDYSYDASGNLDEVSNANEGTVYCSPRRGPGSRR